jgi:hypothetical protein
MAGWYVTFISLLRSDTEELMPFLDGNRMAKVSTRVPAVFSKLKILSTSAMASCTFRLKYDTTPPLP